MADVDVADEVRSRACMLFRHESQHIGPLVAQLLSYPVGRFLARFTPDVCLRLDNF